MVVMTPGGNIVTSSLSERSETFVRLPSDLAAPAAAGVADFFPFKHSCILLGRAFLPFLFISLSSSSLLDEETVALFATGCEEAPLPRPFIGVHLAHAEL